MCGGVAKLPCGGGVGVCHSSVVECHGLSLDFFAVLDAPEQIDDERNLRQAQRHGRPENPRVQVHDGSGSVSSAPGTRAAE